MRRAPALLTALVLLGCALAPAAARADGDPASDYLLGQSAFLPPDAGVPSGSARQLQELLQEARARGFEIRVALIATRYDMGSVTILYRQPKRYARFLGQELYFVYKGRLLVVMPNGFGVSRGGKALAGSQELLDRLGAPGSGGARLAPAAVRAVVRLASAAGIALTVPSPSGPTKATSATHDRILIGAAGALALAVLGGLAGFRSLRRRRAA